MEEYNMLWYLATVYTKHPKGRDAAAVMAAEQASFLMHHGIRVFSPIVHGHAVADAARRTGATFPDTQEFWIDVVDRPFMDACDGLIILMSDNWEESEGIAMERDIFENAEKPIIAMHPGKLPWQFIPKTEEKQIG